MGTETKIQWTDRTWNPWVGCTKVSDGCAHCYAESINKRFRGGENWGKGAARKRASDATLRLPFKWNREAEKAGKWMKVFCLSMGDWLDPDVPIEWLVDLLDVIRLTPWLDWQLLTKRPEQFGWIIAAARSFFAEIGNVSCACWLDDWLAGKPPANVWVGCSAENQERLEERVPPLLRIPAKVRFLSCEPLLGPLFLGEWAEPQDGGYFYIDGIHWVIVGGESGPKARECALEWIEEIVEQCRAAGVPVFVKQLGSNAIGCYPDGDMEWPTEDPKGGDMDEWPGTLRVREFPEQKAEGRRQNEEVKGGRDE